MKVLCYNNEKTKLPPQDEGTGTRKDPTFQWTREIKNIERDEKDGSATIYMDDWYIYLDTSEVVDFIAALIKTWETT